MAASARRSRLDLVVPAVIFLAAALAGCGGSGSAASEANPGDEAGSAKVTVAGDSISLGLGVAMREEFEGTSVGSEDAELEVKAIGVDGTGLARPDNYDWPGRLEELAADFPPDVLVFSVASNDAQDLTDEDGETVATMGDPDAWDAEYSSRLARVFDAFDGTGTEVVWLGHVRTEDPAVAETNRHVHDLATQVAATRDWVTVEDLAELTGSGAESTSECLVDGLHLGRDCYVTASEELVGGIG